MDTLIHDLRYALRTLRRSKGFAVAAILTLALGIGANSAIFSLVSAVMLRPLPGLSRPDQLVWITMHSNVGYTLPPSYPDYLDLRDESGVFSGLIASTKTPMSLGSGGEPERLAGGLVTGNYFSVLGVQPALGRTFAPDEDRTPLARPVAVISYRLWKDQFGADTALIGERIILNGHSFTVIGVAPKGFVGAALQDEPPDIWVPAMMQAWAMPREYDVLGNRGMLSFQTMGRLKPGTTLAHARAAVAIIGRRIAQAEPVAHGAYSAIVSPLAGGLLPGGRRGAIPVILFGLVVTGIVLLIACANVANLLLGRAASRRKEIGIRLALGAGRWRLVRQLLTESMLLALAAGVLGLLICFWATDLLVGYLGLPITLSVSPDMRVLAATLALALGTGFIFGLAPALSASRPDVVPALKTDTFGTHQGSRRSRLQSTFVVAQIALSMVLLVAAGLLVRSLRNAHAVDVGLSAKDHVVMLAVDLRTQGYDDARGTAFFRTLLDRVRVLPDVASATLAVAVPLGGPLISAQVHVVEREAPPSGRPPPVYYNSVYPDFFHTLGIPLVEGRDFSPSDNKGAPRVVIVSEAMARAYWPGDDPLGKQIRTGPGATSPVYEVVGVAKDAKISDVTARPGPYMYFPYLQYGNFYGPAMLLVRAEHDPAQLISVLRSEAHALDPALPLFNMMTIDDIIARQLATERAGSRLLTLFGVLALLLAAIGVYGVMAYAVAQRTREIGIRMALGAQRRDVLSLVVGDGTRLALLGVIVGVLLTLGVTRVIASMLIGVGTADPLTLGGVALLLGGVALLASYLPARRATKVDPMTALRSE